MSKDYERLCATTETLIYIADVTPHVAPSHDSLSVFRHATQFFRDAGLTAGMRVLDVGCSTGDVSILAARLVAQFLTGCQVLA